ncbi:beta-lactamase class D (Penicillin-binding protein) (OXA-9) [gamma proteobacterium HdN1]|nr:beta-lactamase class D (Penicillin-binding protein) (OXA-9) [gamma proteobacterium HdN1]
MVKPRSQLAFLLVVISVLFSANAVASEQAALLKCTLVVDAATGSTLYRNGDCTRRASPCSSFKIPLAIMGFESGILHSPESPTWELKPEYNPSKRDQMYPKVNPVLWERDSVVWFSQHLTTRLGEAAFSDYIKKFQYGNQDGSGDSGKNNGLTRSWLMSSLAISPEEQVQFLHRFIARQLPISRNTYEMVRATIPQYQAKDGWVVHGKSGSGWLLDRDGKEDESRPQGWFVGWAEKAGRQVIFARLEIGNVKSDVPGGTRAREEILSEIHALVSAK